MFKVSFEDYIKTLIKLVEKRDFYAEKAKGATDTACWEGLEIGARVEIDDLMDLFGLYFKAEDLTVDYLTSHLKETTQQGQGESPSFCTSKFHALKR